MSQVPRQRRLPGWLRLLLTLLVIACAAWAFWRVFGDTFAAMRDE